MQTRKILFALAATTVLLSVDSAASQTPSVAPTALLTPPVAPVKEVIDDFYGTKVSDPYRYMENLKDPAVAARVHRCSVGT